MTWTAAQMPRLGGRVAVVTGGNSGLGRATATELARHGARVMLACRDIERGKQAADDIRNRVPDADIEVRHIDLADMTSVREFGEGYEGPLHLLINNAGVMGPPRRQVTAHDFELQFGTNHLGHFVLTGLLLPALLVTDDPRVVTVSSVAHHGGTADVLDGNAVGPYRPQRAYANSKLANLLFAFELQRRASAHGVPLTSTAAHPGFSATGLVADPEGAGANRLVRAVLPPLVTAFTQSAATGARAILFAATEADPGSFTGPQRLHETRGPIGAAEASVLARDETLARQLWRVSEELTGFRYRWSGHHR
jgi:NAD(P)-dependent dehydrogenase (short-subunit alcohol dehydrogenase family)